MSTTMNTGDVETESDSGGSTGDGQTGGQTTSGAASGADSSTGMATSMGPMGSSTGITTMGSTSDGGNGMQPTEGMYAPCRDPNECSTNPALCVTVTNSMMMLIGGFCTNTDCTNAAVDCDPSPGGTAIPICIEVEVNDDDEQACALACAGATCPPPMQCQNVTGLGEICV